MKLTQWHHLQTYLNSISVDESEDDATETTTAVSRLEKADGGFNASSIRRLHSSISRGLKQARNIVGYAKNLKSFKLKFP